MSDKKKIPGRIRIIRDNDPTNPREEYDNITVMVCTHKRYSLGDKKANNLISFESYSGWAGLKEALEKKFKPLAIEPLYMYDHSGLTISTSPFSCPWDSGQVGFVLVPNDQETNFWDYQRTGVKEAPSQADIERWAKHVIEGDVKVYDQYLRGDVYGFIVDEAVEDFTRPGEQMLNEYDKPMFDEGAGDSCWGFYGSDWKTNGMADSIQPLVDAGYTVVTD